MPENPSRQTMTFGALLLTVAIGMIGFGIALPLLPSYAQAFGIEPWQLGLIFSIFSIGQAVGEAIWGRLSDRYGRKPILILTLAISTLGYVAMAYAPTFMACLLARLMCGFGAGNSAVVQALMIDISKPEKLTARLAMLGACGGIGFVIGPALSGLLAKPQNGLVGFEAVFLLAAGLSLAACLTIAIGVPAVARRARAVTAEAKTNYRIPTAALALIGIAAGVNGVFAGAESVLGLWTGLQFTWTARDLGAAFATAGAVGVVAQLLLIGPMVRRFGDRAVLRFGLVATAIALFMQAFAPSGHAMITMIGLASFGLSMSLPTVAALLSREASAGGAGRLMGAGMAASALARIVGPLFAGLIYAGIAPRAPFLFGAGIVLATLVLTLGSRAHALVGRTPGK